MMDWLEAFVAAAVVTALIGWCFWQILPLFF